MTTAFKLQSQPACLWYDAKEDRANTERSRSNKSCFTAAPLAPAEVQRSPAGPGVRPLPWRRPRQTWLYPGQAPYPGETGSIGRDAAISGLGARAALVLLVAAVLTACGTSLHRDTLLKIAVPARVTVTTSTVRGLGPVLTTAAGQVLYMFPNDAGRSVTCTGGCAGTWPPLVIADGHHPAATGAAERTRLGTLPDPNTGARVVTYDGNPLYRYAGDTAPHTANGQDIESDGGPWYVLTPAGKPVTAPITQADTTS